jgi:chromosome segregation ATPase
MTRDELRNCMALQARVKEKAAFVDEALATLQRDKLTIASTRQELAPLRAEMDAQRNLVQLVDAEVRAHAERVDQWSADLKEAEESKMMTAERRKKELERERGKLSATAKELTAKRDAQFKLYEAAVARFNVHGKEFDATVEAWNQRNEKLANDANQVGELREDYAADCSNRRFREEDEAAIKQGK